MREKFKINLPKNFELICLVLPCDPSLILQDYINGISIPKLLSTHPDDPLGENIDLLLSFTKSEDPPFVQKKIINLLETGYQKELKKLVNLEVEQPELESKIRSLVDNWCIKATELRLRLRKNSMAFKIVGHDY